MEEEKNSSFSLENQQKNEKKTFAVEQPANILQILSGNEPLTDDFLNSILPSTGYKIIPVPQKYQKKVHEDRNVNEQTEDPQMQRIPQEFQSLYTDFRPDEELSPEEKSERFTMKLLMQIKDGTVYQRKQAIRTLTTHAPKLGAELVFTKFLALAESSVISELERHSLVKTLDRLMFRLSDSITDYLPRFLDFIGTLLVDPEPVTRAEGREVMSNIAKICGFPDISSLCRDKLGSENIEERNLVANILATTATAVGMQQIIPLLNALVSTRRANNQFYKDTGIRIIYAIATQNRNGVLPYLDHFVKLLCHCIDEEDLYIKRQTIKCTKVLAEACAPYGGDVFTKLTEKIFTYWKENRNKNCLAAIASLLLTMKQNIAAAYFNRLARELPRHFASTDNEEKLNAIVLFENALNKNAVTIELMNELIQKDFLSSYWNMRTPLMRSISPHLIQVTAIIAEKGNLSFVLENLFSEFKTASTDFQIIVAQCLRLLIKKCDFSIISPEQCHVIIDSLLIAFDNAPEEKVLKIFYQTIDEFNNEIGDKILPILDYVTDLVHSRIDSPNSYMREKGAKLFAIFAKSFAFCGNKPPLMHYYEVFQEMFVEEYPNALAAVISAVREIANVLDVSDMRTKPNEVIPRLVPILKNRNRYVAFNTVKLISTLTTKEEKIADDKEWMRICFELIELFRAEKRKIRDGAIQAFGDIAKAISPFDILLALLNNLKVQDRQIRLCTTLAISVLAQSVGPYIVLPALMNEYRTPDMNVQNGALKAMQFLFQAIGRKCADYCYAVTPLLVFALIERDNVHRQQACSTVCSFVIGCFASGKEDAILHIFNHLLPNVFEPSLHFVEAFMNAMDAMRLTLGPGVVLQHTLAGLFHPARKVRSQFWRIYNNLIIYSGGELVPYYPLLESTEQNEYNRDEFDVFI